MKRIYLLIFFTLALGTMITSCDNNVNESTNTTKESTNMPEDTDNISKDSNDDIDEMDKIQEARELMLDWQVKRIYEEANLSYDEEEIMIPISTKQAEVYISQKEMLDNNSDYKEKIGFDSSSPESNEEKIVLDELHQYLGYWMLMRENMSILNTVKENDDYYSMVVTSGYDFPQGIYLVHYILLDERVEILNTFEAPEMTTLQNIYLGVVNQDKPICFGFAKKLKYNSEEDKFVESDINEVNLITTDDEYKIPVNNSEPFIIILSEVTQVTGYKAMNTKGDCIEEKELTELDLADVIER